MGQRGFEGPGWGPRRLVELVRDGEVMRLFVNGQEYMSWRVADELSAHLAMVQLYRMGAGSQGDLAGVFGIHEKSVYNHVQAYCSQGAVGLVAKRSGPKVGWKLTPRVRGKILHLVFGEGVVDPEVIERKLEKWGESVGVSSIREVLKENGAAEVEGSTEADTHEEQLLFDEKDDGQEYLDLRGRALSGTSVSTGKDPGLAERRAEDTEDRDSARRKGRDRSGYSGSQRRYLNRLERGEYSAYAGGLLFAAVVERHGYLPILERVLQMKDHEGYSPAELCLTLLYLDVFGFRSMEDFKRAYAEEFGFLIGRGHSPSHFTLRRFLHRIREVGRSQELIEEFGHGYLSGGLAEWGVMYVDGHFLPYYGMYPISKGWHGVRKVPMKGSYHFLACDEWFAPWIFLIHGSEERLLQKLPEIVEKAKAVGRRTGLTDKQLCEVVVVFDREGYSGDLFRYLDGRDEEDGRRRALFVTWSKYAKWVYDIAEDLFDKTVTVRYEIQKERQFEYYETERVMSKYGKIRCIVVQRRRDGRRASIYTNATEEELSGERVVQLICRRWGEENLIKSLMQRHFINYSPGYVNEPMEHQPLMDNPRLVELKKKKSGLIGELHKLKVSFTDKMLKEVKDEESWAEIRRTQTEVIVEIARRENEIFLAEEELAKLPKKIPYDQGHAGRRLQRLNHEKKRFLDCIKVFSYNMQREMCRILLKYYGPAKEVLPALSMIVNRGGHIKLENGRLCVRLRGFKNPEIDYAARHLCEELNAMHPRTLDRYAHPIHYQIQ